MTVRAQSTIAQVLYPNEKALDFARIVAELQTILARLRGNEVRVRWDCDDLVTFDLPEARILLAASEFGRSGQGSCLTVSVGPSAAALIPGLEGMRGVGGLDHAVLCSRLIERIQYRFVPAAILWQQVEGMVDAELVDRLADELPQMGATLPTVESILESVLMQDRLKNRPIEAARAPGMGDPAAVAEILSLRPALTPNLSMAPDVAPNLAANTAPELTPHLAPPPEALAVASAPPMLNAAVPKGAGIAGAMKRGAIRRKQLPPLAPVEGSGAANDRPDLPLSKDEALARLRAALYPPVKPEPEAKPSTQIRLAAHCLNATLILVYAPLGAAVMTYSLLQGEDIRFSARMMAVVGTIFGVSQTPFGQTVAAMASVPGWH